MVSQSSVLAKSMVLRMRLLGFAGQAEDEVGVDDEAEVVAVLDEVAGALDGGTLLDVLEDLRIAGLEADDEQAAAGFLHGLEGVAVGGDARGAGPGDAERLELGAELDGARLLDVEGVVVEEELLDVGEVLLGPLHLGGDVVGGTLAPGMAGEGLRPEAEGALGGAAARGVERDVGVKQERDVVLGDVHVALVDLGGPGHRIEVFDLGRSGLCWMRAVCVAVADAEDFCERLALGELDDGEIKLAAADEVDDGALVERAVRVGGDRRADEGDLDGGIGLLDRLGQRVVAGPADGGGERARGTRSPWRSRWSLQPRRGAAERRAGVNPQACRRGRRARRDTSRTRSRASRASGSWHHRRSFQRRAGSGEVFLRPCQYLKVYHLRTVEARLGTLLHTMTDRNHGCGAAGVGSTLGVAEGPTGAAPGTAGVFVAGAMEGAVTVPAAG